MVAGFEEHRLQMSMRSPSVEGNPISIGGCGRAWKPALKFSDLKIGSSLDELPLSPTVRFNAMLSPGSNLFGGSESGIGFEGSIVRDDWNVADQVVILYIYLRMTAPNIAERSR